MILRGSTLLLASILVSGCWPYLPGSWEDYTTPEETRILGRAHLDEPVGGYWQDTTPYGEIWWGWLDKPDTTLLALELVAPDGVGCVSGSSHFDDFVDMFGDPGADNASLTDPNGDTIDLAWNDTTGVFSTSIAELPIGQYQLDPLAGDEAGNVKVSTFMRVPKPADVDGVDLNEESPITIALSELDFYWNPADELAQYIIVTVVLVDGSDTVIDTGTCASKYVNGDINFATSSWSNADNAVGAQITISTANEQWVEIGERGIASRVLAERREVGFVYLN